MTRIHRMNVFYYRCTELIIVLNPESGFDLGFLKYDIFHSVFDFGFYKISMLIRHYIHWTQTS